MMSEMRLSPESNSDWEKARRSAFIQDILAAFTQRPADLLPFEEVRQHLRLLNMRYLGVQEVPLANIVGSVGELGGRLVESLAPRDRARMDDRMASAIRPPARGRRKASPSCATYTSSWAFIATPG
jgi:hypothetical protein